MSCGLAQKNQFSGAKAHEQLLLNVNVHAEFRNGLKHKYITQKTHEHTAIHNNKKLNKQAKLVNEIHFIAPFCLNPSFKWTPCIQCYDAFPF